MDRPEFMGLYEKMAQYDLPIWLHPVRDNNIPDYSDEGFSKYGLFVVFGWPYETTSAMPSSALIICFSAATILIPATSDLGQLSNLWS